MPTCFVISRIGKDDSEERKKADSVLEYLILPVLRECGFGADDVVRADQVSAPGIITLDILQRIRDADLCIIDVTGLTPNVMYECGLRHGNGKPYVMMAEVDQGLPFDISGIRTVQYDISSVQSLFVSHERLKRFVTVISESGYTRDEGPDSISSISETVRAIEAKIDQILRGSSPFRGPAAPVPDNLDAVLDELSPRQAVQFALESNNLRLLESLLPVIENAENRSFFLWTLGLAASRGSAEAEQHILGIWNEIMTHSDGELQQSALGALVSYCNRTDSEIENMELIVGHADELLAQHAGDTEFEAYVQNQKQRLYWGASKTSGLDPAESERYLRAAKQLLEQVIELSPNPAYRYNYAMVLFEINDSKGAADAIVACLDMETEGEHDEDHLALAYEIFKGLDPRRAQEFLDMLSQISPLRARLLTSSRF